MNVATHARKSGDLFVHLAVMLITVVAMHIHTVTLLSMC